jgi:predicted dehydrogenase
MDRPLTRRDFMSASAAALAVPLILPRAAGNAARAGANDQIGVGFIGIGKRSCELLPAFLDHKDLRVLAVCDVDKNRREYGKKLAEDHYAKADGQSASHACVAVDDHRNLLEYPGIDAVVIATPDHWHCHQIIDACNAGKDIYCEKPLTLTIREAKLAIDVVRKHNRVFQTGSQQRTEYDGRFRTAAEYVRNGRLGQLISVNVGVGLGSVPCDLNEEFMEADLDWDRWLGPAPLRPYNAVLSPRGPKYDFYPQWRLYSEYSGGQVTDMGAHHFDIVQWALKADSGGPRYVAPPLDQSSGYGARLVYDNGVEVLHGGLSGSTFIGTKGLIAVDRGRIASIPDSILKEPLKETDERLPEAPSHLQNWVDCLKSRDRCLCDVEVGARSVTVCHLVNLMYRHRRPVEWDSAKWEFRHDADANRWRDYARRRGYELPAI